MRRSKASGTEHADTCTGCESAACLVCEAAMEVYRTVSFEGTETLWVGTCPECGAEVGGETPEKVHGPGGDAGGRGAQEANAENGFVPAPSRPAIPASCLSVQ
jgi:hypothetical protein